MMQIYLEHPRHGKKIAIDFKEAEADKKMGWKEVTSDQYFNRVKKSESIKIPDLMKAANEILNGTSVNTERDALAAKYAEKFGKAPHHRMSSDSIRQKLEEVAA